MRTNSSQSQYYRWNATLSLAIPNATINHDNGDLRPTTAGITEVIFR
jgi:hypothetical protein